MCKPTAIASLIILGLTLGWLPASSARAADYKPWLVESVKITGASLFSQREIRALLETKDEGLLGLKASQEYNPMRIKRDQRQIANLYAQNGYFHARVASRITKSPQARTLAVTFHVEEGRPTTIRKIEITVLPAEVAPAWQDFLNKSLLLGKGAVVGLRRYREAKKRLALVLAEEAHPLARVEGQLRVYKKEYAAEVIFQVAPGPRILFGTTRVQSNKPVSRRIILRDKTYTFGQPFSQKTLDHTQSRLLARGFFNTVKITPIYQEMKDDKVPILIQVTERKPHSIRFGLGWGTEDKFRMRVLQVNRNFLGLGDTFTLDGKYSERYVGLVGSLTKPYLFNSRSSLEVRGGLEQVRNASFTYDRLFITPLMLYRIDGNWSWAAGYNLEKNHISDLNAVVQDYEFETDHFRISSFPLSITYDDRDSPFEPTTGSVFSVNLEIASQLIGSQLDFFRPVAEWRWVIPLTRKRWRLLPWRLAVRLGGGVVYVLPGTNQVPMVRRFFLGGANSVRGYPWQELGPLDPGGAPLGGEAFVLTGVELRFPISGALGGVVFVDGGNTGDSLGKVLGNMRFTAGVGLRYTTPLGPIRIDWGYQLNPPDFAPYAQDRFYISVGQAF